MRRWLLLSLLVSVAGCGIPIDAEPEPFDLEAVRSPIEDLPTTGELAAAPLYLVGDAGLARVTRDLPEPVEAEAVLESLFGGVTEPEDRSGLSSSIPVGTELLDLSISDGVATVDLSGDFATVGGQQEILAVAQIVLTVAQSGVAESVVFELDGVRTDVPTADGVLATTAVTPDDYATLIER